MLLKIIISCSTTWLKRTDRFLPDFVGLFLGRLSPDDEVLELIVGWWG